MKKFLLVIGSFLLVFVLYKLSLIGLLYLIAPSEAQELEFYGVNDPAKPKIILVGASNVRYNYDFKELNEVFKEYNVIGCHYTASSGLFVTLDKLAYLNPTEKDIIVFDLPHSYYESANFLPINELKTIRLMNKRIIRSALQFNTLYALRSFIRLNPKDFYSVYKELWEKKDSTTRFVFNYPERKPNYVACWTTSEKKFTITSSGFEKEYIQSLLHSLNRNIKAKRVFRYSALKKDDYVINAKRIDYIEKEVPFLNSFPSSVYESKYMFDQWYHLNQCGAALNTASFEKELSNWLAGLKRMESYLY